MTSMLEGPNNFSAETDRLKPALARIQYNHQDGSKADCQLQNSHA